MGHAQIAIFEAHEGRLSNTGDPRIVGAGLALGFLGLGGAAGMGAASGHWYAFFNAYLIAFCFFLAIPLGALVFVTLQHLTRAGWSATVRRLAELIGSTMPLFAVLVVPIVLPTLAGSHAVFEWADPTLVANDHLLQHKAPYLNGSFFAARCIVYFGLWILLARFFLGSSLLQDKTRDVELTHRQQRWAAPAMIGLAVTLSYASVDLIMTLEPHWYSTIIGVYYFAGCFVSCMAVLIVLAKYLHHRGKLGDAVNVEHYHDLGKLLFAFTFFWAYIAFSQYMLIWYANIPEGTIWYQHRQDGSWIGFSLLLLFGHFIIPFLGLISRNAKRRTNVLLFWAIWMLVMHWVDMYYLIAPSLIAHGHGEPGNLNLTLMDPFCMIGMAGLFVAALAWRLQRHRLVPTNDPRLSEAMAFENI